MRFWAWLKRTTFRFFNYPREDGGNGTVGVGVSIPIEPRARPGAKTEPLGRPPVSGGALILQNYQGLVSKPEFLSKNRGVLLGLLETVNRRKANPVRPSEMFAILNAEMAVKNGRIDPEATHSEGERGLLPNAGWWMKSKGKGENELLPTTQENVSIFLSYLVWLKNNATGKKVSSIQVHGESYRNVRLYKDLFLIKGITGEKSVNLLAIIVHGGLYSGAYHQNRSVPYQRILERIVMGEGAAESLRGTGYIHDGKALLANRDRNLKEGIRYA